MTLSLQFCLCSGQTNQLVTLKDVGEFIVTHWRMPRQLFLPSFSLNAKLRVVLGTALYLCQLLFLLKSNGKALTQKPVIIFIIHLTLELLSLFSMLGVATIAISQNTAVITATARQTKILIHGKHQNTPVFLVMVVSGFGITLHW